MATEKELLTKEESRDALYEGFASLMSAGRLVEPRSQEISSELFRNWLEARGDESHEIASRLLEAMTIVAGCTKEALSSANQGGSFE